MSRENKTKKNNTQKEELFKIKELIEKTAVSRETIHFYLLEGLLPQPIKTSKNMSWYSQEHVDRLNTIKELQEKHFLPLKAIKAILTNNLEGQSFTQEQEQLIKNIKNKIASSEIDRTSKEISLTEISKRLRLSKEEIQEMIDIKLITVENIDGIDFIDYQDKEIIEGWVKLKEMGIGSEKVVSPKDFIIIKETVSILFEKELTLLAKKFWGLNYEQALKLINEAIPVINNIFGVMHRKTIRDFINKFSNGN